MQFKNKPNNQNKPEANEYTTDFVKLENGKIPFLIFLDSLSKLERVKILALIEEFREIKNRNERMPLKLSKYLSDGIFELRAFHKNKISRSLYFFTKGKKIIFTNGFIKKTFSTPKGEINKAIKYKKIYLETNK